MSVIISSVFYWIPVPLFSGLIFFTGIYQIQDFSLCSTFRHLDAPVFGSLYEFCPVHADHTIVVTFSDEALADCSDEAPVIDAIPVDPYTGSEEFVDALPASGEENTIYYVTNGDGYDIYYWDGTSFVKIA